MPLPPLSFALDDPVAPYLERFPDLAAWLEQAGHPPSASRGTWRDVSTDPAALLAAVATEVQHHRWEETTDWSQESLSDLVHHLIDVHHAFLRAELPRLRHLLALLARDHHGLQALSAQFSATVAELLAHLDAEEGGLFPLCLAIDSSRFGVHLPLGDDLRQHLHHLDSTHHDRDRELAVISGSIPHLRALHDPRANAFVRGLSAVTADLGVHASEETAILMPAVTHLHDLLETRPPHRRDHPSAARQRS